MCREQAGGVAPATIFHCGGGGQMGLSMHARALAPIWNSIRNYAKVEGMVCAPPGPGTTGNEEPSTAPLRDEMPSMVATLRIVAVCCFLFPAPHHSTYIGFRVLFHSISPLKVDHNIHGTVSALRELG